MSNPQQFKRLEKGTKFEFKGAKYRKATSSSAYKLKENGTGETHAPVPFSRSSSVTVT